MQRDLSSLRSSQYDLVVIGGGIYGACIARDAALRGLQVALVERGDWGNATSHNSLKLIHGGLRYLQHLDFRRMRQSLLERRFWLSMAPHLVRPLKFVIPAYGHGTRGPEALWSAIKIHELIGFDRNRKVPLHNQVLAGGLVSRRRLLKLIPNIYIDDVSAGAYWYDAQMLDPNRLLIEVVQSAVDAGAVVANYLAAEDFILDKHRVIGIRVRDRLRGREFEIRGRLSINATGPWTHSLMSKVLKRYSSGDQVSLSKGMNLVTRSLGTKFAFGVRSARRSDAVIGHSQRIYFVTPLANCAVIGSSHMPFNGDPDECYFTEADAYALLKEINAAYPPANLSLSDVYYWYGGLTPADKESSSGEVKRWRRAKIIDHATEDGMNGLISVISVKYTTARLVAEDAVNLAFRKLGFRPPPCLTSFTPLPGARDGQTFSEWQTDLNTDPLQIYGSNSKKVRDRLEFTSNLNPDITFKARSQYAVDCEMAVRLQDIILRRTDLARQGQLTEKMLRWCADMLAQHLQWSESQKAAELDDSREQLAQHGVRL